MLRCMPATRSRTQRPLGSGGLARPESPGVQTRKALRVADLFAGAGGLSEGFRQAGFEVVAATDIDPDAAATYRANFPGARVIVGDIRTPAVRRQVLDAVAGTDVIVGGPPCQAFSQVRNHARLIDDPRNSLYREFVSILRDSRPAAFVMENVTGIDQMGAREQIAADLALGGDYVVAPQIVDAADFGVPQTRKRLLFVGVRCDLETAPPVLEGSGATRALALARVRARMRETRYDVVIEDSLRGEWLRELLTDPSCTQLVTAAQAISDLASLGAGRRDDVISYAELPPPESAYQKLMRDGAGALLFNVQVPRMNADTTLRLDAIPPGGNHRDLPDALLERYLTGQRWGQANGSGRLSRRHFYAYRRLHPDMWAWTLNTKGDSVYHHQTARSLSVREFARLQSFPDRFVVTTDPRKGALPGRHDGGPAHSRYRQLGNAVPPLLARAVAEALGETLHATVATVVRTAS